MLLTCIIFRDWTNHREIAGEGRKRGRKRNQDDRKRGWKRGSKWSE
jgi:hypothetical protein